MQIQHFTAADGARIVYRQWLPDGPARSMVQVVHGAAEHGERYDRFARALNAQGHGAVATDHRGHGLTRVRSGALGDAGPDGWTRMVQDEIALTHRLRAAHPAARVTVFGHSLGSFIAQDYITREPRLIDALMLSGTAWRPSPALPVLAMLNAAVQVQPLAASTFWSSRFAEYNEPFGGPTGFEWLSRDEAEVRRYVDDPLCGFAFTNELVRDIFEGFGRMRDPAAEARIAKDLPLLVIQGEKDPVGEYLAATRALLDRYAALGLTRVQHHFYDGARHELLNEINRDEVTGDVLRWLSSVIGQ